MPRPFVAWLLILLLPLAGRAQGKLQQVRQEVRGEEPRQDHDDDDDDDDGGCDVEWGCDDDDDVDLDLFGGIAAYLQLFAEAPCGYFLPYPYAQEWPGYMWVDGPEPVCESEIDPLVKPWMVRLSVEESNDFDGLNRVNFHFLTEHASRWGLQGSWSTLTERLPGGGHDSLTLADFNITHRFLQTPGCQFRWGLGARCLSDAETDWGFNVTWSGDLYPCKPIIVSTQMDIGSLGDADVFHARGTIGASWRCFEIFGGYDYLKIGSVDLQGPVIGLRLWF